MNACVHALPIPKTHTKLSDKQHTVKRNWRQRSRKKDVPLQKRKTQRQRHWLQQLCQFTGDSSSTVTRRVVGRGRAESKRQPLFWSLLGRTQFIQSINFPLSWRIATSTCLRSLARGLKFNQSNYYDPFWKVGAENSNMCIVTSSLAPAHRTKLLIGFACRTLFPLRWLVKNRRISTFWRAPIEPEIYEWTNTWKMEQKGWISFIGVVELSCETVNRTREGSFAVFFYFHLYEKTNFQI